MTIGETLKYLRKQRNVTQNDVSKALKITRQAYTNYENDIREPDIKTLVMIADYFMVSLDIIAGRIIIDPQINNEKKNKKAV